MGVLLGSLLGAGAILLTTICEKNASEMIRKLSSQYFFIAFILTIWRQVPDLDCEIRDHQRLLLEVLDEFLLAQFDDFEEDEYAQDDEEVQPNDEESNSFLGKLNAELLESD